jgi:hypothetical protein
MIKMILMVVLTVAMQACFSAEVEQLSKRISGDELQFEGFQPDAVELKRSIIHQREFEAVIDKELLDYVEYADLHKVVLRPRYGVDNLDFVKSARIGFSKGKHSARSFALYSRGLARQNEDGSIPLVIDTSFEHTDYFKNNVPMWLRIQYEPPEKDWAVDIDLILDVILNYAI